MKNPLTPAGIEPATFRFVAQHLNHCATAVLFNGYWDYFQEVKRPGCNVDHPLPSSAEVMNT